MKIHKESLTAFNLQKENAGNDAYRKANKLGNAGERLKLEGIATSVYGIAGGHRRLSKKQVENNDYQIV